MKWFWNHCRRREEASLLAADVLSGDEKIAVERHLTVCAQCRVYYNDLRELAATLTGWEQSLSSIEATPALRTRWAKAVRQGTATPSCASRASNLDAGFLRTVWRELIRPSRYVWSGLAALWVAMLVVHAQLSDHTTARTSSSPQEILQAWKEQNRVFAEWDRPDVIVPAVPAHLPRPRSQREPDWTVI